MCVEVVQDQLNDLRLRVTIIHQPLHLMGEIQRGASLGHFDVSPSGLRLDEQKEVARAIALVLVIKTLRMTGQGRQRHPGFFDQLLARLVEVDLRALWVVRRGVEIKRLFHRCDELAVDRRDTPMLFQPRLELVFLSVRRTVSSETVSTIFNSTSRSASNCIVHRVRP